MKYEDTTRRRRSKLLLIVGFLALAFAIVRAHFAPAQGYELSIYGATPITVWLGMAIALVVAVGVTALRPKGWLVPTALVLAILAVALLIFMPTVRGYYGYGQADALTHLGWARGIVSGEMGAMDIFYPGGHSAVGLITAITGLTVPKSMMLFVQLLSLGFLVFVPLTVRMLVDDLAGTAIAVFAACLFMPVTNISTYLDFHPYSLATFFFPVVLFLLFEYLSRRSRGLANGFTATGFLLFLSAVASIVIHGQVALNVLILFGTIALVQKFHGILPGGSAFAEARSLVAPTVLFAGFYVLWASRYEIVYRMFGRVYDSVYRYIFIGGETCETCGNRAASASDAGVNVIELFMKLFFVKSVFVALAAILVLVALAGRLDDGTGSSERNEAVTYFAYSGLVLGPFFLAHFVGSVSRYFFRHVGFAMVIATILGAVMLHSFYRAVSTGQYERTIRVVAAIAILGGLLLSLLVVFPSPYVSLTTNGVSEQMSDGYETGFQYDNNEARWTGLRSGPERYEDALRAPHVLKYDAPSNQNFTDNELTSYAGRPYYLVITEYDQKKEVGAYEEVRYTQEGFDSIEEEAGISRVMSNGEFTLYYVDSDQQAQQNTDGGDGDTDDAAGDDGSSDEGEADGGEDAASDPTATPEPEGTPIPEVTPEQTDAPNDGGDDGEADDGETADDTTGDDGADTGDGTGDGAGAGDGTDGGAGDGGGTDDGAGTDDGTAGDGSGDDGAGTGDGDAGAGGGADNTTDGGDAGTGGGTTDGPTTGGNGTGGNTTGSLADALLGARSPV
ncbi:hypothetical protein [Halomarina oriensis]|uniref:Uncharacterized protein n=1 Tax=Halomarina oriensis TaxID=671145 RepID=A0A6B0GEH7_9EURY|nr:hypothetical protein [Halomarina oriensis]MWG33212.1 hypothetical protein [Halomarina oriensis]